MDRRRAALLTFRTEPLREARRAGRGRGRRAEPLREISVSAYGWPVPLVSARRAPALGEVLVARRGSSRRPTKCCPLSGRRRGTCPRVSHEPRWCDFRSRRCGWRRVASDEALADALAVGRRADAIDHGKRQGWPPCARRPPSRWPLTSSADSGPSSRSAREELERARVLGHATRRAALALRGPGPRHRATASCCATAVGCSRARRARLELARSHGRLGARPARVGRELDEARESLRLAIDVAHACDARPLAEDAAPSCWARARARAGSHHRRRRTDAERAPDRRARGRRSHQPPDRPGPLRDHGDGRVPSAARVPQARRALARRAGGAPLRVGAPEVQGALGTRARVRPRDDAPMNIDDAKALCVRSHPPDGRRHA